MKDKQVTSIIQMSKVYDKCESSPSITPSPQSYRFESGKFSSERFTITTWNSHSNHQGTDNSPSSGYSMPLKIRDNH